MDFIKITCVVPKHVLFYAYMTFTVCHVSCVKSNVVFVWECAIVEHSCVSEMNFCDCVRVALCVCCVRMLSLCECVVRCVYANCVEFLVLFVVYVVL